jgi:hypothetical protein
MNSLPIADSTEDQFAMHCAIHAAVSGRSMTARESIRMEMNRLLQIDLSGWMGMVKAPKKQEEPEVDPERGDAILKRMLQTKPKTHKEAVAERKSKRGTRSIKKP